MIPEKDVTSGVMLLGTAAGIFAGFCGSLSSAGDKNIRRQRVSAGIASAIVVATGYAVHLRSNSDFPLLAAIGISAVFVGGYEYMMSHPVAD